MDEVNEKEKSNTDKRQVKKRKMSRKKQTKNLMAAVDSAIERLGESAGPGGEIEEMDIKDLKNLISSIKDLSMVSLELSDEKTTGGVIVLPEVEINE